MSVFLERDLTCPRCDAGFSASVAASLNAQRHHAGVQALLARQLHVFTCPGCGHGLHLDTDFTFVDLPGRLFVLVRPRQDLTDGEHWEGVARRALYGAFRDHPDAMEDLALFVRCRVVFGAERLREKVVCWQAGLEDALVECLKLRLAVHDAAWRVPVVLDAVDEAGLHWQRGAERICTDRAELDALAEGRAQLLDRHAALFQGAWVDVRRLPLWRRLA